MKNNIKFLRRSPEFDLTQQELAEELGISRSTINSIESGAVPSGYVMLKISRYFNRDIRYIFFEDTVVQIEQKGE
ncbi:putative transcriptional regulator [Cytobacillus horneckiae]|uniref:helix-turn-helix domain-containing protein n=1 Tax=Cytobacillus horneckiae TaxID=549687 RepID=UPI0019D1BEC1|nr:helix-turn-helix domain-containing protein [Cytobacillus horneckiae]